MGPPGVGPRRRPSGIPRSRGSSREPSPSRSYGLRYNLRTTPPVAPSSVRPHLTENILKQSREAESALADALVSLFFGQRNRPFSFKKSNFMYVFLSAF